MDARRRTLNWLADIELPLVDWLPPHDRMNGIGTVLYHIAAIEASWLYEEILQEDFPPEVEALFPVPVRDQDGKLSVIQNLTLERHLDRLQRTRAVLLDALRGMPLKEFRRPRTLPDYDVTPEWVLHHLAQHESEHRGEMQVVYLLAQAERNRT
jgi:uncharacterized damage-inducible protein DinB